MARILLLAFVILTVGCTKTTFAPSTSTSNASMEAADLSADEKSALKAELDAGPVRTVAYWGDYASRPLQDRVGPCDPELIKHSHKQNLFDGYSERPEAIKPSPGQLRDVRGALESLPAGVHRLVGNRVASICFVRDLGTTAWTDDVHDDEGTAVAAFMVLDLAALERTANARASWKENSPFKDTSGWRVEMTIEEDAADNRLNAIRYILLHELGHLVTIGRKIHPSWSLEPSADAHLSYPYLPLSWVFKGGDYVSRFDARWPTRKDVKYYRHENSNLPDTDADSHYRALAATNIPSLYGATHQADDFAEAFALYVHTQLDQRPWSIKIMQGDKIVRELTSCFRTGRCPLKRAFLETLFANP